MSRNLSRGCQFIADLGGNSHDMAAAAGLKVSRNRNQAFQRFALDYLRSGSVTILIRYPGGRASTRRPLPFLISGRCWRARAAIRCGNRSCRVGREGQGDGGTIIVAEADGAAVRLRDRLHNCQPETSAPPGAGRRSEAHERMGQIAVGEAGAMITNPYLNSYPRADRPAPHSPRHASARYPQVAQGILQALPVRRDHAVV